MKPINFTAGKKDWEKWGKNLDAGLGILFVDNKYFKNNQEINDYTRLDVVYGNEIKKMRQKQNKNIYF